MSKMFEKISDLICTMFNCISWILVFVVFVDVFLQTKTKCALTSCEYLQSFQPVNSHLRQFRAFWDDVCTKTTRAEVEVCNLQLFQVRMYQNIATKPKKINKHIMEYIKIA